jgi:hypothetical protein
LSAAPFSFTEVTGQYSNIASLKKVKIPCKCVKGSALSIHIVKRNCMERDEVNENCAVRYYCS